MTSNDVRRTLVGLAQDVLVFAEKQVGRLPTVRRDYEASEEVIGIMVCLSHLLEHDGYITQELKNRILDLFDPDDEDDQWEIGVVNQLRVV